MLEVQETNDPAELEDLRPSWDALLPRTPGASFFQSLDWLNMYWHYFGDGLHWRVLSIQSDGHTIGILPLVVRTESTRIGRLRVLTYPLHDWGTFYGPIGPDPGMILRAGLAHIHKTRRDWDLLELRWVHPTVDRGQTAEALAASNLAARCEAWAECPQIDLTKSWESYWMDRSSRWRNNVRRSEKKLAQRGQVEYLRYRPRGLAVDDGDPRWDLYDACQSIAGESWQGNSDTGTTLSHESVRPFLRDVHRVAAHAGAIDVNVLLLDDEPVAFNYAYQYQGYVFGLRTGFSRRPEADGAGSVLQLRMIEDCFARGDHTYDLGAGYLDCKRPWQTHVVTSLRYTHFPRLAVKSQFVRLKRWLTGRAAAKQAEPGYASVS